MTFGVAAPLPAEDLPPGTSPPPPPQPADAAAGGPSLSAALSRATAGAAGFVRQRPLAAVTVAAAAGAVIGWLVKRKT